MDSLINKQWQEYDYTSRYTPFPFYYNTVDDKYIYGITKQLGEEVPFVVHKIRDVDTLDTLSLKYYGRPDLYWVIADYNRINDPYTKLFGKFESIKIPTLSNIFYSPGR